MTIPDIIQKTITLSPKNKRDIQFVGIGAVVVLALSCIFYDVFLLPPRNIRHLPHWRYQDFIKKILFKRKNFEKNMNYFSEKDSYPGINLRPDRIGWAVHVSSPSGVKTILNKTDSFPKVSNVNGTQKTMYGKFIGGSNILLSDGEEYKRHRKAANPAFHRSMPVQLFGRMTQTMLQEIDHLQGDKVNMTDLCERLTLDILGRAIFNFEFNSMGNPKNEWANAYQSIMEGMNERFFYFFPFMDQNKWLLLFPKRREAHQKLDKFLSMISDMIVTKREIIHSGNSEIGNCIEVDKKETDLLTLMIESEAQNDEDSLTIDEIRSNLCIFFFAGHETTSNAFAFVIYNLAKHQDVQEKARREAIKHLGDSPEDILPTSEDTLKLTYINQIMKETMRMFGPVVDTSPRITSEDTYIDGAFIPKNTYVTANLFSLHHDEKIWKSPNKFIPERFEPGGEADQIFEKGVNWAPFGGGKRQCIGMNFSLSEQRVMISMLLRKYTWTLPDDSIHKDSAVTSGIISISPVNLLINFKRRY